MNRFPWQRKINSYITWKKKNVIWVLICGINKGNSGTYLQNQEKKYIDNRAAASSQQEPMSSCSSGTFSPYKNKIESEIMNSISTRCVTYHWGRKSYTNRLLLGLWLKTWFQMMKFQCVPQEKDYIDMARNTSKSWCIPKVLSYPYPSQKTILKL